MFVNGRNIRALIDTGFEISVLNGKYVSKDLLREHSKIMQRRRHWTYSFYFPGPQGKEHLVPILSIWGHVLFCTFWYRGLQYTLLNFVPKNLFEQFRRIANFYFLVIWLLQLIIVSPVSPLTSLVPLLFVVLVTAIKQAFEDCMRHHSDNAENKIIVQIVKDGELLNKRSRDIKVGDVVKVQSNQEIPCDLLLLSSSDEGGECYVTTANLDGETNLKIFESSDLTKQFQTPEELNNLTAVIECEQPTPELYSFTGRIKVLHNDGSNNSSSLTSSNLLLKGTTLKNTPFIFGCAVYTGIETKLFTNLKLKSNKFSTVEKSTNKYLVVFLIVLILESSLHIILQTCYFGEEYLWYLGEYNISKMTHVLFNINDFISFLVLFNYIIPISLYVTLEMTKFLGSRQLVWDNELYDSSTDQKAKCNSSDLNEELGQVQYLFTDKTGTITENDLKFQACSINGVKYIEHENSLCYVSESPDSYPHPVQMKTPEMEEFFTALVLCNTVHVIKEYVKNEESSSTENIIKDEYHASSLDEKALVEACKRFNIVLLGKNKDVIEVTFDNKLKHFKKLHILHFDSNRKRMSVIVQKYDGTISVYCKGADVSLSGIITSGQIQKTLQDVNEYSIRGLRTLVVAKKDLTYKEYEKLKKHITKAENDLENRSEKLSKIYYSIEKDLHVLGATAVEDRLQDNVIDTLNSLRSAGIKIWILTGDKYETAISISFSCCHFDSNMILLELVNQTSNSCENKLKYFKKRIKDEPLESYSIVIDGKSLHHAFIFDELLYEVTNQCDAVLCCQLSPLQKANVIRMVKCSKHSPVTAAIGDGANDVSMLQEAHLGFGIMGREGQQAANCSDFAFARFRFLKRALLVHGHYFYNRMSILVLYFFYKNIVFVTPQFYYCFFTGFSPQALYHSSFLATFNVVFTSIPILVYGIFDRSIPQSFLISRPYFYRFISKNAYMTVQQFLKWLINGFWHSTVIFFGVYFLWLNEFSVMFNGQTFDHLIYGTTVFQLTVIIVNLKLLLCTKNWNILLIFTTFGSIATFIFFTLFYSIIARFDNSLYGIYVVMVTSPQVFLVTLLLIVIALLPDMIIAHLEKYKTWPVTANKKKHLIKLTDSSEKDDEKRWLLS